MGKSAKERMREMRLRKRNGIPVVFKHETPAQRVEAYRIRGGEELQQKESKRLKTSRANLKQEILSHYGNGQCSCVKCGEPRIDCLSIDHINGGGSRHLKTIHSGGLYQWLK